MKIVKVLKFMKDQTVVKRTLNITVGNIEREIENIFNKMLLLQCVVAVVIHFVISETNGQELLKNVENTAEQVTVTTPTISSSTENGLSLNSSTNSPTDAAAKANDFFSLNLENFATTSNSFVETTSVSPAIVPETTTSWELIYPEQTSTTLKPSLSSANLPLTSSFTAATNETTLPKYFKVDDVANCQKYFGQCLRQVFTKVLPKLKDGQISLKLPSLDPIYFNATTFQYNSGPFSGFIAIRYAHVYGFTSMKFKKIDFSKQLNKFRARLSILVPKINIIGSYKGDIQVNNVRARPKGDFNVSLTSLSVDLLSLGEIYRKDEHTFLKFTKSNATTALKDSKINATGIFPDQRLNDIVLNVANQYWRDIFNIVLPETRNNWLPILLSALNAVLDMVPFDFFESNY